MNQNTLPQESQILFYANPDGSVKIDVYFQDETVWLTQKQMAELFGVEVSTVNYHLKEIFNSLELQENSTIRKIRIVKLEGQRQVEREVEYYHLDAIISVGYRINSQQATQFRIWATKTLREFSSKALRWMMND